MLRSRFILNIVLQFEGGYLSDSWSYRSNYLLAVPQAS